MKWSDLPLNITDGLPARIRKKLIHKMAFQPTKRLYIQVYDTMRVSIQRVFVTLSSVSRLE